MSHSVELLAQLTKRGVAASLGLMLLLNNIAGAQTTSVVVAMIAVAGIPLVWRSSNRLAGGVLACVLVGMLLYTLPAAVGRAGGQLEERENARAVARTIDTRLAKKADALKQAAAEECSPSMGGRGPNCRRLEAEWLAASTAADKAARALQDAPAPSGAAIIAGQHTALASWLGLVSYVGFALGSEIGSAVLFHLALQPLPVPRKQPRPIRARRQDDRGSEEPGPQKSAEWITAHVRERDTISPAEAFAAYEAWCAGRKGKRMTELSFRRSLIAAAKREGKRERTIAGRKMLAA